MKESTPGYKTNPSNTQKSMTLLQFEPVQTILIFTASINATNILENHAFEGAAA
jgi:hypothetical protein